MEPITKQNTIDGQGYGKGFHDLSDIISHIFKHRRTSWVRKHNTFQNLGTASNASVIGLHAHTVPRTNLPSQSQVKEHSKIRISHHQISEPMFPDFARNDTFSIGRDQLSNRRTRIPNLRKFLRWKVSQSKNNSSPFAKGKGDVVHFVKSSKLTNRLSVDPGNFGSKSSASVRANKSKNSKLSSHDHDFTDDGYRGRTRKDHLPSAKSLRNKRRKIRKGRPRAESGLRRGFGRKFAPALTKTTQELFPPPVRSLSPRTHEHYTIGTRVNSTTKIRNLRRQLARIRAKLNSYLRLAHPRKGKIPSLLSSTNNTKQQKTSYLSTSL